MVNLLTKSKISYLLQIEGRFRVSIFGQKFISPIKTGPKLVLEDNWV